MNSLKDAGRPALYLLALLALLAANAAESQWLTDVPAALNKAKAEKKLVLLDFTGSDWCIWCLRLENEVFSKPEFVDYAKTNIVLVQIDFPRKKKLSPAQQKANEALAQKFNVAGFPTLIILNAEGRKVGEMGYMPGGPKPFIDQLSRSRSNRDRQNFESD
jgi:thioredoxin-related protein